MGQKISLVLGSGGARGLAHIGVIEYLEEEGYEIVSISGCSMGALVGGFYAANKLDQYKKWILSLGAFDIISLLDFDGESGLVSGKRLMNSLEEILSEDIDIQELFIKYTAVASDINEEKEVWLQSGSLLDAIRASISIPIFFAPYTIDGKVLVDGGVLNPVPIAPTFGDKSDLTIAVNLGGEISHQNLLGAPTKSEMQWMEKLKSSIASFALRTPLLQSGTFKVANRSFDTMQANLSRVKLAAYPPDIEITIPRNLCGMFEFHRAKEIIEYGKKAAKEHLQK
ncbi:MAG: serine protease [Epsilonproteobacteria bacterium]|nr:serine protease [Campylobacterota bacterium]